VLRLHRSALWCWLLLVTAGAGTLLWAYGPGSNAAWAEFRVTGCDAPPDLTCDYAGPAWVRYDMAVNLGAELLLVVPLLVGAWAGSALVGRELESGTARLTWTQSVTPVRWLTAKLAVPAALLVPGTLALTLLHRHLWSSDGLLRSSIGSRTWYENVTFAANGTVATAYALLGLAAGAVAGLLLRRALPALGLTVLGLFVLRYALTALRPQLWPTVTATRTAWYPKLKITFMPVETGAVTSTGERIGDGACSPDTACAVERHVVSYYREYHPASHFWPLQLVETGIVLALTALAVAAAFLLLRRRTGAAV
jgi:hypothetical protein